MKKPPDIPLFGARAGKTVVVTMASVARGAEEEVFETPDFAEDDLKQKTAGKDSGLSKTANKVSPSVLLQTFTCGTHREQRGERQSSLGHRIIDDGRIYVHQCIALYRGSCSRFSCQECCRSKRCTWGQAYFAVQGNSNATRFLPGDIIALFGQKQQARD